MKSLCMKVIVTSLVLGQSFLIKNISANETSLTLSELSFPVLVENGALYDNNMCVFLDVSGQQWNTTLGAVRKYVARSVKNAEESGYKHAKNAFEKHIENLEQNLDQVTKKLKHAEEFFNEQNGKSQKQIDALKSDRESLSKQLAKAKDEYQKLNKSFTDKQRDLNASNQYIDELRSKYADLQKGTSELISTLQDSLAQVIDQAVRLEQEINALRGQNQLLQTDSNAVRDMIDSKQLELNELYAKIAQLQFDYKGLQTTQDQLQSDYQAARDALRPYEATMSSQAKTIETLNAQIDKISSDYTTLQSNNALLSEQHSSLHVEFDDLDKAYATVDTALAEIELLYQVALEQYESTYTQLIDYMHKLSQEEAKNNELTARVLVLNNELDAVNAAYEKLLAYHVSIHTQEVVVS